MKVLYDAKVDHEARWMNGADLKLEAALLGLNGDQDMEDMRIALRRHGLEPMHRGRTMRRGARA